MSSIYVRTIVNEIETTNKTRIMVAKSLLTETDIKLIRAYAKEYGKDLIIATMQDICFCEDQDTLVIK